MCSRVYPKSRSSWCGCAKCGARPGAPPPLPSPQSAANVSPLWVCPRARLTIITPLFLAGTGGWFIPRSHLTTPRRPWNTSYTFSPFPHDQPTRSGTAGSVEPSPRSRPSNLKWLDPWRHQSPSGLGCSAELSHVPNMALRS